MYLQVIKNRRENSLSFFLFNFFERKLISLQLVFAFPIVPSAQMAFTILAR